MLLVIFHHEHKYDFCFVLFDGSLIGAIFILPCLPCADLLLVLLLLLLSLLSLHISGAILPEKTNLLEQTASFSLHTSHFPFHHLFTFPSLPFHQTAETSLHFFFFFLFLLNPSLHVQIAYGFLKTIVLSCDNY